MHQETVQAQYLTFKVYGFSKGFINIDLSEYINLLIFMLNIMAIRDVCFVANFYKHLQIIISPPRIYMFRGIFDFVHIKIFGLYYMFSQEQIKKLLNHVLIFFACIISKEYHKKERQHFVQSK